MTDPTTDDLRAFADADQGSVEHVRYLRWAADRIDELENAAYDALLLIPPERVRLLHPTTSNIWGELNTKNDDRQ